MDCSLKKKFDHDNIPKQQYADIMFKCPIIDKQICLWCCLHISEVADPKSRMIASESLNSVSYYENIPKQTLRDWDDMWVTCGKCRNKR